MIGRVAEKHLKKLSQQYPVVTVTGPRQSGKTTLIQSLFKKKPYVNLEKIDIREFAINDPNAFLEQFPDGAVIDEAQRAPELFSYIQVIVDEKKKNNLFVLSGSQHFGLLKNVTQSLAGRSGFINLLPFSLQEFKKADFSREKVKVKLDASNWNEFIYRGFFPRIYHEGIEPQQYYADYTKSYLERDLRDLSSVHNLQLFRTFMKSCAVRIGQPLNYQNIGSDLGVSAETVKNWINLLATSFIVYLLPSYHANIRKQLVKSPKLYFTDVGLAAHLLDIEKAGHVTNHPMNGMLFENLVVMEAIKFRFNQGREPKMHFYKDKYKEVDLIISSGQKIVPLEIKSSKTFHQSFTDNLEYFQNIFPKQASRQCLLYAGKEQSKRTKVDIVNPWGLDQLLDKVCG